jgi:eight-cysteine-cluster-containing protein
MALTIVAWGACDKKPKADDGPAPPHGGDGVVTPGDDDGAPPPDGPDRPAPSPTTGEPAMPSGDRTAVVDEDHPLYGRFESSAKPGECKADTDCHVGGCSSEVCSAQEGVVTTCEVLPVRLPPGSACGCVDDTCRWWHPEGAALIDETVSTERPQPKTGEAPDSRLVTCDGKTCKPGQECISYYGIAGPQGPRFQSCEWRCVRGKANSGCPAGTSCVNIADGPGLVCR